MAKRNEGAAVRHAYDGPDIEHDQLIDEISARNHEDKLRSSSAGESRQKIGAFLEETGMNSQAFSWCRTILKKPDTAKAMDVILSLEKALPMVKAHIAGQEPPLPMPEPAQPVPAPRAEGEEPFRSVDPELQQDSDDFEAHLSRVIPFGGEAA